MAVPTGTLVAQTTPFDDAPVPTGSGAYLYVSTTGSDSRTRAQAMSESTPWLSVSKAITTATAGDVVRFANGTYAIGTQINTYGASNNGAEGTPISFCPAPGANVTWAGNCSGAKGNTVLYLGQSYLTFYGLTVTGANLSAEGSVFCNGLDNPNAHHNSYIRCTVNVVSASSIDNVQAIRFENADSGYGLVSRCTLLGEGNGVIMFKTRNITVDRCNVSVVRNGLYIKHPNVRDAATASTFTNNYVYDCGAGGLRLAGNYSLVQNNLLVGTNINVGDSGGTGTDGNTGWYYDTYDHNTLWFGGSGESAWPCWNEVSVTNLTITNSILQYGGAWGGGYGTPTMAASNYNLFASGNAPSGATFAAWRAAYPARDANSLTGAPTFVGGVDPILQYALASGTGKSACADGSDMGCDVTTVGVNGAS